jgi:hypothetical protein
VQREVILRAMEKPRQKKFKKHDPGHTGNFFGEYKRYYDNYIVQSLGLQSS